MAWSGRWWRAVWLAAAGVVLLVVAGWLGISSARYLALAVVAGVFGIIAIVVVVGAPLRRGGSPRGRPGTMIFVGSVLMVLAGTAYLLPPHPVVVASLVLILGVGLFTIGTAILGGGLFGILGAVGGGLAGAALMMAPTPIALGHVGVPVSCRVRGYDGGTVYGDFTADCPGGRSYPFTTRDRWDFPAGRVRVLVDPHGIVATEFAGQHHPGEDLLVGILSVLAAAGVVTAAGVNRRLRRGQVRPVVKPPTTT
jgi:hypothetical protein